MKSESVASTWSDASPERLLGELLEPLVRILLRSGLDPGEVSKAFLHALEAHRGSSETRQIVHLGAMQRDCMEVMCCWRRDSRFLNEQGLPSPLPEGGCLASFEGLCEAAGTRNTSASVCATLQEFGAIDVGADGLIRPLTPTFLLGSGVSDLAVDGLFKQVAAFLRVVDHNTNKHQGALARFERMCTVAIATELLPVFERTVRERGQEFIDSLDEWLERHRSVVSASESYMEVGAGAYFVDLGTVTREPSESK